jgi:uncharacterized membrane protein YecN with MAPEG domain
MSVDLTQTLRVTPVIAAALGLLLFAFGLRTTQLRLRYRVRFGDGGHNDLANISRAHGNLVEHAMPLLLLLLIWELQGAPRRSLVIAGILIVIARVLHAVGFVRRNFRVHVPGAALTYALEAALSLAVLVRALGS